MDSKSDLLAARIIAAALTAPRFRGRTEILRRAQDGDEVAIRALEMTPRQREIAALHGELGPEIIRVLKLDSVAERDRLRNQRRARRHCSDPIATRKPGNVAARAIRRAFVAALNEANFREATHSHDTSIDVVARGAEGARSESGTAHPRDVGLSNAYARQAYSVATSDHIFEVSAAIFDVPRGERWDGKRLYLSPTCRVRQGRGTSLVCERKIGRKWVSR